MPPSNIAWKPLPLSPAGRRYGWFRRQRDHRAYGVLSLPNLKLAPPPPNDYHLGEWMPPVKDQADLGACTAFAGAADREATARQYELKSPILSPLFLYYMERQLNGSLSQGDCGSDGQTSCQALNQFGICEESIDPYITGDFQVPPTAAQLTAALAWKDGAYHAPMTLEDLKTCINSGYRFRIGMNVYDSFENDIGSNGLMPVPDPTKEQLLGGHEPLAYAYDDTIQCPGANAPGAILVRNSWGPSWGKAGDFWLPYQLTALDSVLAPDFRVQHLGPPWGAARAA